ncbi:MAG: nucleoside kinase [Lachnospiraceae bacterium]
MEEKKQDVCRLLIRGEEKEYPVGTRYEAIAQEYQHLFKDDIILVIFDNNLVELNKCVERDGVLSFVTTADRAGKKTYRRSVTFMMLTAVWKLYPEYSVFVQHSIGPGYFCELRDENHEIIQPDQSFIEAVASRMGELQRENLPFVKLNVHTRDAVKMFDDLNMEDKKRLLRYRRNSRTNIYDLDGFKEYFYGSMAPSTGYLKYYNLELYQNGFMLVFPLAEDTKTVPVFRKSDKLFQALKDSADWGCSLGVGTMGALNDVIVSGRIQDLMMIQEAAMDQKLSKLAEQIAALKTCKFVMIAGPSSSGKTTFSHRLSMHLRAQGLNPHPIALDDFYVDRTRTPLDENGEYDYECLEAIDIDLFNEIMSDLLQGKARKMPTYNFKTGLREYRGNVLELGPEDILVIEGIHGLNKKLSYLLPDESKFKIYISALTQLNIDEHNNLPTADGRLLRRIVRDARTRNTTAEETLARWPSVRKGEEKNIFPFQEEADVMFNSALIYELAVLKLYAEPLLFRIGPDSPEYIEAKRLLKFLEYVLPIPSENINHSSILREFIGGSCYSI